MAIFPLLHICLLHQVVRFIHAARASPESHVYVHCAAGVSRSVTCCCAYLCSTLGLGVWTLLPRFQGDNQRTHDAPHIGGRSPQVPYDGSQDCLSESRICGESHRLMYSPFMHLSKVIQDQLQAWCKSDEAAKLNTALSQVIGGKLLWSLLFH